MMQMAFRLREEEVKHLVDAFDSMGRGEVHLEPILEELMDIVQKVNTRIEITDILTQSNKGPIGGPVFNANPE
jgi:hypothetical protein